MLYITRLMIWHQDQVQVCSTDFSVCVLDALCYVRWTILSSALHLTALGKRTVNLLKRVIGFIIVNTISSLALLDEAII